MVDTDYTPQDLVTLMRWMTKDRWWSMTHYQGYSAKKTQAVLSESLEADPYQALLSCEGQYWYFGLTTDGDYWTCFSIGMWDDDASTLQQNYYDLHN